MNKPLTAPATEIHWRYEPVPTRGKCLLLNPGGVLIIGPPMDEWMVEYIAWAAMPKRDKSAEQRLCEGKNAAIPKPNAHCHDGGRTQE